MSEKRIVPEPPEPRPEEDSLDVWGFRDSGFDVNAAGRVTFRGERYAISGTVMPSFLPWPDERLDRAAAFRQRSRRTQARRKHLRQARPGSRQRPSGVGRTRIPARLTTLVISVDPLPMSGGQGSRAQISH